VSRYHVFTIFVGWLVGLTSLSASADDVVTVAVVKYAWVHLCCNPTLDACLIGPDIHPFPGQLLAACNSGQCVYSPGNVRAEVQFPTRQIYGCTKQWDYIIVAYIFPQGTSCGQETCPEGLSSRIAIVEASVHSPVRCTHCCRGT